MLSRDWFSVKMNETTISTNPTFHIVKMWLADFADRSPSRRSASVSRPAPGLPLTQPPPPAESESAPDADNRGVWAGRVQAADGVRPHRLCHPAAEDSARWVKRIYRGKCAECYLVLKLVISSKNDVFIKKRYSKLWKSSSEQKSSVTPA